MKTVENGSAVKLHYKGTFPDGEVFDDSRIRGEALELLVGAGRLLSGFEIALVGMSAGETKNISLTPEEAYGPVIEDAIVQIPKTSFPENFDFREGITVQGANSQGTQMLARIVKFDNESVTLDHNHPLAGKDINFEIELVEIEETNKTVE